MLDATQIKQSLRGITHSFVQYAARQPVFFGLDSLQPVCFVPELLMKVRGEGNTGAFLYPVMR